MLVLVVVVACADLSGNESHSQVGMDSVMTSRSLVGVMAQNAKRSVQYLSALGLEFPNFTLKLTTTKI